MALIWSFACLILYYVTVVTAAFFKKISVAFVLLISVNYHGIYA